MHPNTRRTATVSHRAQYCIPLHQTCRPDSLDHRDQAWGWCRSSLWSASLSRRSWCILTRKTIVTSVHSLDLNKVMFKLIDWFVWLTRICVTGTTLSSILGAVFPTVWRRRRVALSEAKLDSSTTGLSTLRQPGAPLTPTSVHCNQTD